VGLRSRYADFNKAVQALYGCSMQLADDAPFSFDDAAFEDAAGLVYDSGGFNISQFADPKVRKLIAETLRVIDTAISGSLPHEVPDTVRHALENNAFIFSGFKTYHSLREVGLSLTTDGGDIKPYRDFLGDVRRINATYNHNYLYAEYNHAVGASLMAAKWQDFERDGDRYDLQYRTAGDNRVREEHAILNGTTLPPSDPFWAEYLPPNGWNCRCTAVQVRKGKYPTSDPELAKTRGDNCTEGEKRKIFRFNAGKSLQLFPPKHPYYKATQDAKQAVFEGARRHADKQATEEIRESPNLQTGKLNQTRKAMKRAIRHTFDFEQLQTMLTLADHLHEFRFERFSHLGEGKDMTKPENIKNIENKKRRGITGYNIYKANINGTTWIIKTEVFKHKAEMIYHIKKE